MKYVRAWQTGNDITALYLDEYGSLKRQTIAGEHVAYFHRDVPADRFMDRRVLYHELVGDYWRVVFSRGAWDQRTRMFVDHREQFCRSMEDLGIQSYEGDVSPLRRWMVDNAIEFTPPRRAYLDIETDSRCSFADAKSGKARILCWALVRPDGSHVSATLKTDSDDAERELLQSLLTHLEHVDQIVAWNGDGFDQPVIEARIQSLEVPHKDLRRWMWLDHMLTYKRYNISSADSGEDKISFKLDHVASSLLGEGKYDLDASRTWEHWQDTNSRGALVRYCVQDTDLLRRIEEKTGYLELFQTVCEACGVQAESRSLKPTVFVDQFMLRLGSSRGVRFRSRWFSDELESTKYVGAFVMQPTGTGILRNVHVCDFASLYPSVMITWNLSPETIDPNGDILSPGTGVRTTSSRRGIICDALETLLALRKEWTTKRSQLPPGTPEAKAAERRTNAYKTVANSFYGVVGTPYSRFYDRQVVESTTLNGQWLIKQTLEAANTYQWDHPSSVVYGDTDSLFVMGPSQHQFDVFVRWCNETLYPRLTTESGCTTNRISLAYEKAFELLVFTAAKRYVGRFAHYKGKPRTSASKPEVKGLEVKRGDTNRLARQFQTQIISLLNDGVVDYRRYIQIVETMRQRVLKEKLDLQDVVLSKGISRSLSDYKGASQPAHVRLAKQMELSGEDVSIGTRIAYVVTDGLTSPIQVLPASQYNGECDRYYVWETLVWPASHRLLEAMFPNVDWAHWRDARPSRSYNPDQLGLFRP